MSEVIKGRIGQEGEGFGLRCEIQDEKIVGRAGSRLNGKNIELEITDSGVAGRVGNEQVHIELAAGELRGTVGDQSLVLRGVDRVTGYFGEPIVGWNISAQQQGDHLEGTLGSTVLGRPFSMDLAGAPGWIGTLLAVLAFYALEPRASVKAG